MPSASSAKLEKQASSEATDPIKQGIVFVEHKIRNLVKKKVSFNQFKLFYCDSKTQDTGQYHVLPLEAEQDCQIGFIICRLNTFNKF